MLGRIVLRATRGAALGLVLSLACGDDADDAGGCGTPPVPTFVHGDRSCDGIGFVGARVKIGDVKVKFSPGDREHAFAFHMTGWQPASQGVAVDFELDARSYSMRMVIHGPAAIMQGVRGMIIDDVDDTLVTEASADAAGDLELALTYNGLGHRYRLVLENWPVDACDQLSIELPC